MGFQQPLPNATLVLVLSILSIPLCCCYGIIGLGMAIAAFVLANKDKALYESNPTAYTPGSYSNINTGRILAIIGMVLGGVYTIITIISFMMFGFSSNPQEIQERLRDIFGV